MRIPKKVKLLILIIPGLFVVIGLYKFTNLRICHYEQKPEFSTSKSTELKSVSYTVKSGDTLDKIFSEQGLAQGEAAKLLSALRGHIDLRRCQIGDELEFTFNQDGALKKFHYEASIADIYDVKNVNGNFEVTKRNIPLKNDPTLVKVSLENSLYQAFTDADEKPELVENVVDIFAWDIDFFVDPKVGDKITLLVEKIYANNKFYRYGKILAAHYDGQTVDTKAFLYRDPDGKLTYFDHTGKSLARNFLKTPLKFTRISSTFGLRTHPVTHRLKHHSGTDYAAPTGTPVWAMGSGVITRKSYNRGNGNFIEIKHRNGYETSYLHLSRFYPGIHLGKRVSQKELIGYVGSTGLSTGPHLHLGIRYNGQFVDALKLKKIKEFTLTGLNLEKFHNETGPLVAQMETAVEIKTAAYSGQEKGFMETGPIDEMVNEDFFTGLATRTE